MNIRIKKYNTYDTEYIKNNIPVSNDDYDERIILKDYNSISFKVYDNSYLTDKTILIYIELNYNCEESSLYKYSFQKIIEYKELEFKSYDINWFINYEFNPVSVKSKDIIFISTNHSNTVFPLNSPNYKQFESFHNGYLFVSFPDDDSNKNQIKIKYSDENIKEKNDEDKGHMEIYKFNNEEMTFEVINFDESIEAKIYSLELRKNMDKYFYIKINNKENYYIFYEEEDNYSFLTIEEMPIDIIKFSKNNINNDIKLISYNNEYLLKIGYTRLIYSLMNIYIIKNENSRNIDLEEGKVKMITYPFNEKNIIIQIDINEKIITNETYINLKIPSKNKNVNLYVISLYTEQTYLLNNTGINIYNINWDYQFRLEIQNSENISEPIPILIKLGINHDKIKLISEIKKYEFNYGDFGIIKYEENKKIKMKFKTNSININFNYYNYYLDEDSINYTSKIISPEFFNNIKIPSKEYNFEINTELDLNKTRKQINNNQIINEHLFLIFSFDGKVEVFIGEKSNFDEKKKNSKLLYLLFILLVIIILIFGVVIYMKKFKNKKEENSKEKTLIKNGESEDETYKNNLITVSTEDPEETDNIKNNLVESQIEIENIKVSKINDENNKIDVSQPAPVALSTHNTN